MRTRDWWLGVVEVQKVFRYLVSDKGADVMSAWGIAPGIRLPDTSALKARFTSAFGVNSQIHRASTQYRNLRRNANESRIEMGIE